MMITYYVYEDEDKSDKVVSINVGDIEENNWKCSVLDADSTMEEKLFTFKDGKIELEMNPQSVILLECE